MKQQDMGHTSPQVVIENMQDSCDAACGLIPQEQVRRVTLSEAFAGTEATLLALPARIIQQLGLNKHPKHRVTSSVGLIEADYYDGVTLRMPDCSSSMDVIEVPDGVPVLLGWIPLENVQLVVDPLSKPTFASVTDEQCHCGYLRDAADDPDSPIVFDARLNEFIFEYPCPPGDGDHAGAKSMLRVYHCPFCGGAAPKSKRGSLFASITIEEENRLSELLAGIATLDDATRMLGQPDRDEGLTQKTPEQDGNPPRIESFRTLVYCGLSETAEVYITDFRDKGVGIRLQGEYIGLPISDDRHHDETAQ